MAKYIPPIKKPKATVPRNSFFIIKKSNAKVDVPESIASIILYSILLNVIINRNYYLFYYYNNHLFYYYFQHLLIAKFINL